MLFCPLRCNGDVSDFYWPRNLGRLKVIPLYLHHSNNSENSRKKDVKKKVLILRLSLEEINTPVPIL